MPVARARCNESRRRPQHCPSLDLGLSFNWRFQLRRYRLRARVLLNLFQRVHRLHLSVFVDTDLVVLFVKGLLRVSHDVTCQSSLHVNEASESSAGAPPWFFLHFPHSSHSDQFSVSPMLYTACRTAAARRTEF